MCVCVCVIKNLVEDYHNFKSTKKFLKNHDSEFHTPSFIVSLYQCIWISFLRCVDRRLCEQRAHEIHSLIFFYPVL